MNMSMYNGTCTLYTTKCHSENIGVPGVMHDTNASQYIGLNEWDGSILADDGYPVADSRFIVSDNSMIHKEVRAPIEHVFGDVKVYSALVGAIYGRSSAWHDLAIWAAFILHNQRCYFGPLRPRLED